ncbi:MAG: S-layer homology domain-containing protein, partial [Clostridia bacterium]|nr:S-layer homology domain-containing protein [Clostridia bacterium]
RAMFVTRLHRAEGEPSTAQTGSFADVTADSYYSRAVEWAAANGIVTGYSNVMFAPDDYITREQIAAIMLRYADYKGAGPVGAWAIRLDYTDLAEVSDYAGKAVMYCSMKGIMQGRDNGKFAPKDCTTRAEAAVIIKRFLDNMN